MIARPCTSSARCYFIGVGVATGRHRSKLEVRKVALGDSPDRNRRCSTCYSGADDLVGDHHGLCLPLAISAPQNRSVIGAQNDRFTVERCTVDRPRGPASQTRDARHAGDHPVSIELDFVQPAGPRRWFGRPGRAGTAGRSREAWNVIGADGDAPEHTSRQFNRLRLRFRISWLSHPAWQVLGQNRKRAEPGGMGVQTIGEAYLAGWRIRRLRMGLDEESHQFSEPS
jgi:hypothetical protein